MNRYLAVDAVPYLGGPGARKGTASTGQVRAGLNAAQPSADTCIANSRSKMEGPGCCCRTCEENDSKHLAESERGRPGLHLEGMIKRFV